MAPTVNQAKSPKHAFTLLKRATAAASLLIGAKLATAQESTPTCYETTKLVTDYVLDSGATVGKGPAIQPFCGVSLGKYFSAELWADYDFTTKALEERDIYLNTRAGPVSLSIQDYDFPAGTLRKASDVFNFVASADYESIVNFHFQLQHVLNNKLTLDRNCFTIEASKSFKLYRINNTAVSFSPTLKSSYNNNFLGTDSMGHLTPGASLQFRKGAVSTELYAKHQYGFNGRRSFTYGGLAVSISDLGKLLRKDDQSR